MGGTTATLGLPYPTSDEPVANGAHNIEALAEAIDPLLHGATSRWYDSGASTIASDKRIVAAAANSGGGTYQARNMIEAWLPYASLISIGEDAPGNSNPAITFYRTASGYPAGNASRIWKAASYRGFVFQHSPTNSAAYGSETYTTFLELDLNGKLLFGPEGAQDTNLYRSASSELKTDGSLVIAGVGLYLGAPKDTYLYRSAAGTLKTDATFIAGGNSAQQGFRYAPYAAAGGAFQVLVTGEAAERFDVMYDGKLWWGPGGSTSVDTNLYRAAAGVLRTDGQLQLATSLVAGTAVYVDNNGGGAKLYFGSAADTSLYRSAAGTLKTDGALILGSGGAAGYSTLSLTISGYGTAQVYRDANGFLKC